LITGVAAVLADVFIGLSIWFVTGRAEQPRVIIGVQERLAAER
jgi:hypothetical protein